MPSFSACCAASSERCTSAPQVITSTSIPFAAQARLAERDHEVFAGVLALVVGLAVQVLVLEEQHRVVAADRGAQQAGRVHRRSTETRCGCPGSARRCSRPTGCGTGRRRAGSRRSARGSPSGTTSCCPIGSASSTSRRASASSPARCSRRTGSRRPASARASPCRCARPMMFASASGALKTRSSP